MASVRKVSSPLNMIPARGTGGSGIESTAVLSCRANAGNLRDRVGRAATRSVFAAAFCIAAMLDAVKSRNVGGAVVG